MPRSVDEEFVAQRNEMRRIDQSSDFMTGYVYRVDREARTADIMTSSGVLMEDLPGHAGFLPEPGQQVQLLMNGNAPVLMPPNTADIVSLEIGRAHV